MTRWNNRELGAALGVTSQRVSQLVKSGILPKPNGGHDPFTAVPAYISFISQRLTGSSDLKAARIAKYHVETALRELDLRQRSGELLLRAAVEREFFSLARSVRDSLQNLPPRVAGLCAAERSQDRIFALLTREIDQCLEGLANCKATA